MITRVAKEARDNATGEAGALLDTNRRRRVGVDVADLRVLEAVLQTKAAVGQRYPPQIVPPQGGERVQGTNPEAGSAAGELIELRAPVEGVEPGRQVGIEQIGLGEAQVEIPLD